MAISLTPIQINQIINKKAGDPITADDWNGILNLLIEQNNLLSEQLQSLKSNIQQITTDIVQSLLDNGTLSLNVDASKLGGILAAEYALHSDITSLSEAIANSYTDKSSFEAFKTITNTSLAALKSKLRSLTLYADNWSGTKAPYTYTITVSGVTDSSANELLLGENYTTEELEAFQEANIQDGGQSTNTIVLKAYGDKPTVDIPIRIIIRGDLT